MGTPHGLLATGLTVAASLASPADGSGQEKERDVRSAIHAAWTDHVAAARRSDLAGVMELYGEDAVYLVPGSVLARGHAEIEQMEARTMASAEVLEAYHATESIRVYGDVAYEVGTVVGRVRPNGEPTIHVGFRYMATWRRESDGTWRVGVMAGEYLDDPAPRDSVTPDGEPGDAA